MLHVRQNGPVRIKVAPLLPEQEGPKIGDVAEVACVEFLDEPHPCSLDQVTQQPVEGAKAVGDTWLQSRRLLGPRELLRKLETFKAKMTLSQEAVECWRESTGDDLCWRWGLRRGRGSWRCRGWTRSPWTTGS